MATSILEETDLGMKFTMNCKQDEDMDIPFLNSFRVQYEENLPGKLI